MKEKKLEASTSCSISEGGTLCMIEVEQPDCCKYVGEHSYNAIILIFICQKKLGLAIVGHNWSRGPCEGHKRTSA